MAQYEYGGRNTLTFQHLPGYKKIVAWQAASDLGALVNAQVKHFGPGYYRLSDQMRGCIISIPGNIAEGYASGSLANYLRYGEIARGSAGELGSYIQDCERWGLIEGDNLRAMVKQYSLTTYFLDRLLEALRQKQKSGTWERGLPVKEAKGVYLADTEAEWDSLYANHSDEQITGIADDWTGA